jgi:hypothetical protein
MADTSYNKIVLHVPITLNISGGEVLLANQQPDVEGAIINADVRMASKYISEFIQFREDIDNNKLYARVFDSNASDIAREMNTTVNAPMHFAPFPQGFRCPATLGDFVVSYVAHMIFGHPGARTAVLNADGIVNSVNYFTEISPLQASSDVNDPTGEIANRIVLAILQESETSDENDVLRRIVDQVLCQDKSRYITENTTDDVDEQGNAVLWSFLKFYDGDEIFIKIRLTGFSFKVATNELGTEFTDENAPQLQPQDFMIRIILGDGSRGLTDTDSREEAYAKV